MNSYYAGFTRPKTQKLPGSGYRGILYLNGKRVWLCEHEHARTSSAHMCAVKQRDGRNRQAPDPVTGGQ